MALRREVTKKAGVPTGIALVIPKETLIDITTLINSYSTFLPVARNIDAKKKLLT